MPSFNRFFLALVFASRLIAQPIVGGSITQPAGGSNPTITVANASSTGTTTNTLTKLTGAPSTAVIAATTDTGGVVGIVTAGAGTTGSATIQIAGLVNCVFDGGTTAGHYVQISSGTGGDCHDSGAAYPTSGMVIGRVLSTNGSAGTYQIDLFPAEIQGGSGGGAAGATLFTYVNATGTGPNNTASETSLIGTATTGSKTIPANTMIAGQLLESVVTGQITTPVAPDNLTLNMYMGATKIATGTVAAANIHSLTTNSISFKTSFFILTGGASCSALVEDVNILVGALVAGFITNFQGTGTTFDCTASQAFDFKAQWANAQSGESIFGQGVGLYIPGAPVTSVNGQTGAVTVTPFFQKLTAPVAANFTAQNFNTGSGVVTTQVNNTSPVTSITLLQHDPSNTGNIAALDQAVIASKSFTLSEGLILGPTANTAVAGLYLSDGGSPPHLIIFGYQAGESSPFGINTSLVAYTATSFTTIGASTVFSSGPGLSPFMISGPLLWLRVVENATNRIYEGSSDGITYAQFFSESVTAHFTTARYGIALVDNNATANAPDIIMTLYSFSATNP